MSNYFVKEIKIIFLLILYHVESHILVKSSVSHLFFVILNFFHKCFLQEKCKRIINREVNQYQEIPYTFSRNPKKSQELEIPRNPRNPKKSQKYQEIPRNPRNIKESQKYQEIPEILRNHKKS